MNRADSVIECRENVVGIIKRAVGQNIDFARFQHSKSAQSTVQLVDKAYLRPQIVDRHAARDLEALRMIPDPYIFIVALPRGGGHLLDRVGAVA